MSDLLWIFSLIFSIAFSDKVESSTCPDAKVDQTIKAVEYYSENLPLVILDYNDLLNRINLQSSIASAYGPEGLGILLVRNVPKLKEKREELLLLARSLAHLNEADKKEVEHPESHYSVGWSHGKEKLARSQPDFSKGSFYANPVTNDPTNGNQEWITQYPAFYHPNLWPDNSLPQLQDVFMQTGTLLHEVGKLIAYQMDQFVSSVRPHYTAGTLINAVSSNLPKGRLLYYFSPEEMQSFGVDAHDMTNSVSSRQAREDNWCGWHNDHSSLTGLILGRFFDEKGDHPSEMNDPVAGLYVKTRTNQTFHIQLNELESSQHLAFQIGETSQILSGGTLLATPHAVKGAVDNRYSKVSRASFAVFMQPNHLHHMRAPEGISITEIQFDKFLPPTVPPLAGRWWNETGDTFGLFTARTLSGYY